MPTTTTRPKPTVEDFTTPEVIRDVRNYLTARVIAESTRTKVNAIEVQLLTEREFTATFGTTGDTDSARAARATKMPTRIRDPKSFYLQQDQAAAAEFYAEANRRERAAGIKPAAMSDDHCPALAAENLLLDAERVLIDSSGRPMGITHDLLAGEKWAEWLNLVVRMVVNHPSTRHHFADAKAVLASYNRK